MFSSILYKQLNFGFARHLQRAHLSRYFENKADNAYKAKQQLEAKLSIPKIPEKLFKKVFNDHPKIFLSNNKVNERFESKIKKVRQLAQKYQLAKCMESCLYSNRYILFRMQEQELQSLCETVESNYGFTKEQISSIFTNYYRTINPKLTLMLDQKISLLHDYLHLSKQEIISLLAKHPLLIPASRLRIKQTMLLLLQQQRSLGAQVLTRDRIIKLLHDYPEVFILGRHQIKDLVSIYQEWGLDYKEVWQLILDNPLLLNNYPFEIMPIKRRLFKYFKFTKQMGRLMVKQYPLVLLSSISSLEAKLIFIKDRLKLPINATTLQLLQYKFSEIRPRGELLARAKEPFTLENIVTFIQMSDQEFAKKIDIPLQRLIEEKQRFKQTDEIDWRRRKVLKGSGVEEKVKAILNDMREQLNQTPTSTA